MSTKLNDLSIDLSNTTAVAIRRDDTGPKIKKLDDVYEQHAKLVFLFDHSSSMTERLSANYIDNFIWSPELMATIKLEAETTYQQLGPGASLFFAPMITRILYEMVNPATGKVDQIDDTEIQRRLVQHTLTDHFKVPVNWAKHKEIAPTRLDCVKKIARRELERRLEKYPNSNVAMIQFDGNPDLLFNDGPKEQMFAALDRLVPGGSTDILKAIRMGLEACAKSPSSIGLHHFIVVSDGEDYQATNNLESWVPSLKASGVVMDYIHIGDRDVNAGIRKACEALGGLVSVVNTEKDLDEKFVDVIQRKCLPPA